MSRLSRGVGARRAVTQATRTHDRWAREEDSSDDDEDTRVQSLAARLRTSIRNRAKTTNTGLRKYIEKVYASQAGSSSRSLDTRGFVNILKSMPGGQELTDMDFLDLINFFDTNSDERIDFDEFVSFVAYPRKKIRDLARRMRSDMASLGRDDKYLTKFRASLEDLRARGKPVGEDKLTRVLRQLDLQMTDGEVHMLMDFLDFDGSGFVEAQELIDFLEDHGRALATHSKNAAVVEIEMRPHRSELHKFTADGYIMVSGSGKHGAPAMCVLRATEKDVMDFESVRITDLTLSQEALSTDLVIDGFERLEVPFDRHFVWFRRNASDPHPITEVALTHGKEMPPFGRMRKLMGTRSYHLHYHKEHYSQHEYTYTKHHPAAVPELLADVIRLKLRKRAMDVIGGAGRVNSLAPVPDFTALFHTMSGSRHGSRSHWSVESLKNMLCTKLNLHAQDMDMKAALSSLTKELRFDLHQFLSFCQLDEVETKVWRMSALYAVHLEVTNKLVSLQDLFMPPVPHEAARCSSDQRRLINKERQHLKQDGTMKLLTFLEALQRVTRMRLSEKELGIVVTQMKLDPQRKLTLSFVEKAVLGVVERFEKVHAIAKKLWSHMRNTLPKDPRTGRRNYEQGFNALGGHDGVISNREVKDVLYRYLNNPSMNATEELLLLEHIAPGGHVHGGGNHIMTFTAYKKFILRHDRELRRDAAMDRLRYLFRKARTSLGLKLRAIFDGYDQDHNGKLTKSELNRCVAQTMLKVPKTEAEARQLCWTNQELLDVFDLMDRDGSGFIDVNEFTAALNESGRHRGRGGRDEPEVVSPPRQVRDRRGGWNDGAGGGGAGDDDWLMPPMKDIDIVTMPAAVTAKRRAGYRDVAARTSLGHNMARHAFHVMYLPCSAVDLRSASTVVVDDLLLCPRHTTPAQLGKVGSYHVCKATLPDGSKLYKRCTGIATLRHNLNQRRSADAGSAVVGMRFCDREESGGTVAGVWPGSPPLTLMVDRDNGWLKYPDRVDYTGKRARGNRGAGVGAGAGAGAGAGGAWDVNDLISDDEGGRRDDWGQDGDGRAPAKQFSVVVQCKNAEFYRDPAGGVVVWASLLGDKREVAKQVKSHTSSHGQYPSWSRSKGAIALVYTQPSRAQRPRHLYLNVEVQRARDSGQIGSCRVNVDEAVRRADGQPTQLRCELSDYSQRRCGTLNIELSVSRRTSGALDHSATSAFLAKLVRNIERRRADVTAWEYLQRKFNDRKLGGDDRRVPLGQFWLVLDRLAGDDKANHSERQAITAQFQTNRQRTHIDARAFCRHIRDSADRLRVDEDDATDDDYDRADAWPEASRRNKRDGAWSDASDGDGDFGDDLDGRRRGRGRGRGRDGDRRTVRFTDEEDTEWGESDVDGRHHDHSDSAWDTDDQGRRGRRDPRRRGGDSRRERPPPKSQLRVEVLKAEIDGAGKHLRHSAQELVRCDMTLKANSNRIPSLRTFRSRTAKLRAGHRGTAAAKWQRCAGKWAWTDYQVMAAANDRGLSSPMARRRMARVTPSLHVAVVLVDASSSGRVRDETVVGEVVVPLAEALGEFASGRHKGSTRVREQHDGSQVYSLIDSEVGERIGTITLRLRGRRPQPAHGSASRPRPTVVVDLVSLQRQYMQLRRAGRLPTDNLHHFFAKRAGPDRGVDGSMSALAFERAVLALGLDLSKSEIEALVEQFRLDDDEFPGDGTRVEYSLFVRLLTGSGPYSREAGHAVAARVRGAVARSGIKPQEIFRHLNHDSIQDGMAPGRETRLPVRELQRALRVIGCHLEKEEMLPMLSSLGVALDSDSCVDYTSFLRALETSEVGDAPEFKPLTPAEAQLRNRVRTTAWVSQHMDLKHRFVPKDPHLTGRVTVNEFQSVLSDIGVEVTEAETMLLSRLLDVDSKGKLDYYRFCRYVELDPQEMAFIRSSILPMWGSLPPAVRQQAFQTGFDPHKTGFLDAAQFINALSTLGLPINDFVARMLARKFALASQSAAHVVGTNVSQSLGKVNYESFLAWVDGASGDDMCGRVAGLFTPSNVKRWLQVAPPQEQHRLAELVSSMMAAQQGGQASNSTIGGPLGGTGMSFSTTAGLGSSYPVRSSMAAGDTTMDLADSLAPTTPVRGSAMRSSGGLASPLHASPSRGDAVQRGREKYFRTGIWQCDMCRKTQTQKNAVQCEMCFQPNPYLSSDKDFVECVRCHTWNKRKAVLCKRCAADLTAQPAVSSTPSAGGAGALSTAGILDTMLGGNSGAPTTPKRQDVLRGGFNVSMQSSPGLGGGLNQSLAATGMGGIPAGPSGYRHPASQTWGGGMGGGMGGMGGMGGGMNLNASMMSAGLPVAGGGLPVHPARRYGMGVPGGGVPAYPMAATNQSWGGGSMADTRRSYK